MACPTHRNSTAWSIERCLAGLLALALVHEPVFAQGRETDPELEALVPDSALADPQAWVEQGVAPEQPVDAVDLQTPMTADAGFTLPWPDEALDLPELAALEPEPGIADIFEPEQQRPQRQARPRQRSVERVSSRLTLVFSTSEEAFPEEEEFVSRFETLSAIEQLSGKNKDNLAQLSVRASSDRALLKQLLQVYGYYDAEIVQVVNGGQAVGEAADGGAADKAPAVRFSIRPGTRYSFGTIDLGRLADAGRDAPMLRGSFAIQPGDPLYADRIVSERADLDTALGETGYPFAKIGEPELTVDHKRTEGDLSLPVEPGGKYTFGRITSNMPRFLPAGHLEDIARFDAGDTYRRSRVDDLRRAILATGLVSSVTVTPRETVAPQEGKPGEVALDVALAKAPLKTIAGALGYDSGEGARAEVSWEHRNFFPPEGLLRLRGILGSREQLAGVTFVRNNFKKRDQVLTADLYGRTTRTGAVKARSIVFNTGLERRSTFIFQRPLQWGFGMETAVSSERIRNTTTVPSSEKTYYIAALPMHVLYDGSNDLLDPTRGFRTGVRLSPELAKVGGGNTTTYAKAQFDASYYQPVGERFVLAGRARLGMIVGAANDEIAPSRRLFAGGGGSVRGYGYQAIGPRDSFGNPTGGRSLAEFSLEARVNTGLMGGAVQVVPFVDAGSVDESTTPKFRDIRFGAGLGIRYKTGFGPIRVDVGTPLNRRAGDSRIAIYVALGQAF